MERVESPAEDLEEILSDGAPRIPRNRATWCRENAEESQKNETQNQKQTQQTNNNLVRSVKNRIQTRIKSRDGEEKSGMMMAVRETREEQVEEEETL